MDTAEYPSEWETDIVLGDGSTAHIRPIRPEDAPSLAEFHKRQSQESIYFRFFRFRPELSDRELEYFTTVDYDKRMAFVVMLGGDIVAVARYEGWDSPKHPGEKRAEVAFFVDDAHHGKGIATITLEFLAAAGRRHDFDGFTATVLPENVGMLRVFRKAGFDVSTGFDDGVIDVDLGIEITEEATHAIESRERRAQARSIAKLLAPTSVAIIGASREPGSVGYELVRTIAAHEFAGELHAVNPAAVGESIAGVAAVGSIGAIDGEVDLAIIAVPAAVTEAVVEECVEAGVGGLLIVSVGFSDAGEDGRALEERLVTLARGNGLRLIGPNSFGLVNTDPELSLHAMFVSVETQPGAVGVLSQSGPLGAGLLQAMTDGGAGVSSMVAVGNRADVSVNDLIQYWSEDERTKAMALYLDNYGNMSKFARIARRASATKPIVAVSPANETLTELLEQSGVVLVDHVDELVAQCALFIDQPLPEGNRVAIASNAASVGRLAAQACRREGLEVVVPGAVVESRAGDDSDALLIGDADTLDLARSADFSIYEEALVGAAVSAEVDMILVAIVPTPLLSLDQLSALLERVDRAVEKPMVATRLVDGSPREDGMPMFAFPEEAAKALGRVAGLVAWRGVAQSDWFEAEGDWSERARAAASLALRGDEERTIDLRTPELAGLANLFDLAITRFAVVDGSGDPATGGDGQSGSLTAVADAADSLGYPVVLKGSNVADRSAGEEGGAALDLHDRPAVQAAVARMIDLHGDALFPLIVQRQARTGWHVRAELVQDEYGARILFGVGGVFAELVDTHLTLSLPASRPAAEHLTETTWLHRVVPSQAGRDALIDVIERLAVVADGVPEVVRLAANPMLVSADHVALVDIEVTLRASRRGPLAKVRHLG